MTYLNIDIKQNSKFVSLRHTKTLNIEIWTQKFKIDENMQKRRIKPRLLEHRIKIQLSIATSNRPRLHRIREFQHEMAASQSTPPTPHQFNCWN